MSADSGDSGVEGPAQGHPPHEGAEAPLDLGAQGAAGYESEGHYAPQRLALDEHDHLPWLEAGEDDDYHEVVDVRRVTGVVVAGLLALAAVVGGVWFATHHNQPNQPQADGSTVAAPDVPFKAPPQNPGGKTFQGTGDTSFAVSQGRTLTEHLAETGNGGKAAVADGASAATGATASGAAAKPAGSPTGAPAPAPASDTGAGGGVAQIGAFHSQARAEQAWSQMVSAHQVLAGVQHRVVAGQVDGGTVYRLQVLTAAGGAGALCDKLHAAGLSCQPKS